MWKEKVAKDLISAKFELIEEVLHPSIRSYLNEYDKINRTDPFVLLEKVLETEGPIILNDTNIRKTMLESLTENQLLSLKNELNIDIEDEYSTLEDLINQIITFEWNWGSQQVRTFCTFFGIGDVIEEYFSLKSNETPNTVPDTISPLEGTKNFFELHSFQSQLRDRIVEKIFLDDEKRILLRVPTGGGKTRIAVHTLIKYLSEDSLEPGSVLWLSYSPLLVHQACETFCDIWRVLGQKKMSIRKLFGSYSDTLENTDSKKIYFANIVSLYSKLSEPNIARVFAKKIGLIIFDEVHQLRAPIAFKLINELQYYNNDISLLGLTATPGRGDLSGDDSLDLIKFFPCNIEIIVPPIDSAFGDLESIAKQSSERTAISYLQEIGVLAKLHEKRIQDNSGGPIGTDPKINRLIIDNAKQLLDEGKKIVIFASNIDHAKTLSFLLRLDDYEVGLILGENRELRDETISKFKSNRELNVLITYDVLTAGFDAPQINAIIIARPTDSVVTYSQILGRALRGPLNGGNSQNFIINITNPRFGETNQIYKLFSEYWR